MVVSPTSKSQDNVEELAVGGSVELKSLVVSNSSLKCSLGSFKRSNCCIGCITSLLSSCQGLRISGHASGGQLECCITDVDSCSNRSIINGGLQFGLVGIYGNWSIGVVVAEEYGSVEALPGVGIQLSVNGNGYISSSVSSEGDIAILPTAPYITVAVGALCAEIGDAVGVNTLTCVAIHQERSADGIGLANLYTQTHRGRRHAATGNLHDILTCGEGNGSRRSQVCRRAIPFVEVCLASCIALTRGGVVATLVPSAEQGGNVVGIGTSDRGVLKNLQGLCGCNNICSR